MTTKKTTKTSRFHEALSPEELIARHNAKKAEEEKAKEAAAAAKAEEEAKKPHVTEIWVKALHINPADPSHDVADLQFTYSDGSTEDDTFDISTTGVPGEWSGSDDDFGAHRNGNDDYRVSGSAYKHMDSMYKSILQNLRTSKVFKEAGVKPDDKDVRISMIHIGFAPLTGVQWVYGKDRISNSLWAFGREMPKVKADASVKAAVAKKVASGTATTGRGRPVYQSGNTRIYKLDV